MSAGGEHMCFSMGFIIKDKIQWFILMRERMCMLVSLSLCICVCICIPVCLCVWVTSGAMLGGYTHMCGYQRTILGVILRNTVCFFDIVSLLGLKLTNWVSLTGQWTPRIPLSLQSWDSKLAPHILPAVVVTGLYSHACMSLASPNEPSFQPRKCIALQLKAMFSLTE